MVLSALAIVLAGAAASAGAGEQPVTLIAFESGKPAVPLDEAVSNLECMLGFRALARYHKVGLRGFAARLSSQQLSRLQRTALVRPVPAERGSFLLHVAAQDSDTAERRIAELQRRIGFTVDVRFNRGYFRGWGAALGWRQLASLDSETDIHVTQNPSVYVIWFDQLSGDAAAQRTAELEQKHGFRATVVLRGLGAFGAALTNTQLAALSEEPDLVSYNGAGDGESVWIGGPPHVTCLRPTARVRRDLAQAFKPRHAQPWDTGPVGRVLYARLARPQGELGPVIVTEHALATFRTHARTVTELFERSRRGRWKDLGRLPATVCDDKVRSPVLEAWLFRPVSPYGCYTRN
jgi:hypothetical protein